MQRISRKMIDQKIELINNLSNKEIVYVFWKGTGLKSDLKVNGLWIDNLTNKQMYNRLEEIMQPIRKEYLQNI